MFKDKNGCFVVKEYKVRGVWFIDDYRNVRHGLPRGVTDYFGLSSEYGGENS